jgi:hypothetical protein
MRFAALTEASIAPNTLPRFTHEFRENRKHKELAIGEKLRPLFDAVDAWRERPCVLVNAD